MSTNIREISGLRKSAILMLNLDEDTASNVFKAMSKTDVQLISQEISTLSQVTTEELGSILAEFMKSAENQASVHVEVNEHLRSVLTKALGEEQANDILDDIAEDQQNVFGIDKMNLMDASTVAEMIREEHPQIIATILVHLDRGQAGDILELFEDSLFHDVMLRILTFKGVQPGALEDLTKVLSNMLEGQNLKRSKMGGVRAAAEILNSMTGAKEDSAVQAIKNFSEDLAQKVMDEMFLFENLINLDPSAIQIILQEVDGDSLAVALKGAEPELVDLFIGQMSVRAAEMFREDMEQRGPVRVSLVESEQKAILQQIKQMANEGRIDIEVNEENYV